MYKRAHICTDYPILKNHGETRKANKIKFDIPRPKYDRFKAYPLHQGAMVWHKLDAPTQKTENYRAFKNLIKNTRFWSRMLALPCMTPNAV